MTGFHMISSIVLSLVINVEMHSTRLLGHSSNSISHSAQKQVSSDQFEAECTEKLKAANLWHRKDGSQWVFLEPAANEFVVIWMIYNPWLVFVLVRHAHHLIS